MAKFLITHVISSSKAYFTTELLTKYCPLLVSVWWGLEAITAWKPPLPVRDDQWHEWALLWIHSQSPRIKLLDSISTYNWWLASWTQGSLSERASKDFLFFPEYWCWLGDEAMTCSCAMAGNVSKMSLYQSLNGSLNILVLSRLHHWDYTRLRIHLSDERLRGS